MEKILITGTAGFIGYHTVLKFLAEGYSIVGLDNINNYYDINLKYGRMAESGIDDNSKRKYSLQASRQMIKAIQADSLQPETYNLKPATVKTITQNSIFNYGTVYQSTKHSNYQFIRLALEDYESLQELFEKEKFDIVVHLAAQAGVRYSLTNPFTYIDCNINGHMNILEACRHNNINHLVYASSSSVYGSNTKMPLSTSDNVDHPISLYAATKKSNELMSHTYSHLYDLPVTGLRFFTVYGPWGRPDMALFLFTKAMLENKPIDVYNYGEMWRDFTYVNDIIEGVYRVTFHSRVLNNKYKTLNTKQSLNLELKTSNYKIYNIGNSSPVKLTDFIKAIEKAIGKKAKMDMMDIQPGDVPKTWADTSDLEEDVGYKPNTPIEVGVRRFVEWYRSYFGK